MPVYSSSQSKAAQAISGYFGKKKKEEEKEAPEEPAPSLSDEIVEGLKKRKKQISGGY